MQSNNIWEDTIKSLKATHGAQHDLFESSYILRNISEWQNTALANHPLFNLPKLAINTSANIGNSSSNQSQEPINWSTVKECKIDALSDKEIKTLLQTLRSIHLELASDLAATRTKTGASAAEIAAADYQYKTYQQHLLSEMVMLLAEVYRRTQQDQTNQSLSPEQLALIITTFNDPNSNIMAGLFWGKTAALHIITLLEYYFGRLPVNISTNISDAKNNFQLFSLLAQKLGLNAKLYTEPSATPADSNDGHNGDSSETDKRNNYMVDIAFFAGNDKAVCAQRLKEIGEANPDAAITAVVDEWDADRNNLSFEDESAFVRDTLHASKFTRTVGFSRLLIAQNGDQRCSNLYRAKCLRVEPKKSYYSSVYHKPDQHELDVIVSATQSLLNALQYSEQKLILTAVSSPRSVADKYCACTEQKNDIVFSKTYEDNKPYYYIHQNNKNGVLERISANRLNQYIAELREQDAESRLIILDELSNVRNMSFDTSNKIDLLVVISSLHNVAELDALQQQVQPKHISYRPPINQIKPLMGHRKNKNSSWCYYSNNGEMEDGCVDYTLHKWKHADPRNLDQYLTDLTSQITNHDIPNTVAKYIKAYIAELYGKNIPEEECNLLQNKQIEAFNASYNQHMPQIHTKLQRSFWKYGNFKNSVDDINEIIQYAINQYGTCRDSLSNATFSDQLIKGLDWARILATNLLVQATLAENEPEEASHASPNQQEATDHRNSANNHQPASTQLSPQQIFSKLKRNLREQLKQVLLSNTDQIFGSTRFNRIAALRQQAKEQWLKPVEDGIKELRDKIVNDVANNIYQLTRDIFNNTNLSKGSAKQALMLATRDNLGINVSKKTQNEAPGQFNYNIICEIVKLRAPSIAKKLVEERNEKKVIEWLLADVNADWLQGIVGTDKTPNLNKIATNDQTATGINNIIGAIRTALLKDEQLCASLRGFIPLLQNASELCAQIESCINNNQSITGHTKLPEQQANTNYIHNTNYIQESENKLHQELTKIMEDASLLTPTCAPLELAPFTDTWVNGNKYRVASNRSERLNVAYHIMQERYQPAAAAAADIGDATARQPNFKRVVEEQILDKLLPYESANNNKYATPSRDDYLNLGIGIAACLEIAQPQNLTQQDDKSPANHYDYATSLLTYAGIDALPKLDGKPNADYKQKILNQRMRSHVAFGAIAYKCRLQAQETMEFASKWCSQKVRDMLFSGCNICNPSAITRADKTAIMQDVHAYMLRMVCAAAQSNKPKDYSAAQEVLQLCIGITDNTLAGGQINSDVIARHSQFATMVTALTVHRHYFMIRNHKKTRTATQACNAARYWLDQLNNLNKDVNLSNQTWQNQQRNQFRQTIINYINNHGLAGAIGDQYQQPASCNNAANEPQSRPSWTQPNAGLQNDERPGYGM